MLVRRQRSRQGAHACINLCEENGGVDWDGDAKDLSSSGRPRETTKAMIRDLTKLVFKHRGRAKVTVAFVQKMLPMWQLFVPENLRLTWYLFI